MIPRDMLLWRVPRVQVDAPVKHQRSSNQSRRTRQTPHWRPQFSAFCAVVAAAVLLMPQARAQSGRETTDLGSVQGTVSEAATLPRKIDSLAQQIYRSMLGEQKSKVAILPLGTLTGESTVLGLFIADKLTNALFAYRDKFDVVDRMHLDKILSELKLSQTGAIDPATVQKLGKLLGADAIVAGTITDLGTHVDVTMRLLGAEEGRVLAVASEQFLKDASIEQLLHAAAPLKSADSEPSDNSQSQPPKATSKSMLEPIAFPGTAEGLAGWEGSSGNWQSKEDVLPNAQRGPAFIQIDGNSFATLMTEIPEWGSYILEVYAKFAFVTGGGSMRVYPCGASLYDNYFFQIRSQKYTPYHLHVSLSEQKNGVSEELKFKVLSNVLAKSKPYEYYSPGWHRIRISVTGNDITCSFDGVTVLSYSSPGIATARGVIGIGTHKALVHFTGIRVTPLN